MIAGGRAVWIPCAPCGAAADPTGAGNSSTAAVLCGWCQGKAPAECGAMGAVSAARCIEQFGPPDFSAGMQAGAQADLAAMLAELEGHP